MYNGSSIATIRMTRKTRKTRHVHGYDVDGERLVLFRRERHGNTATAVSHRERFLLYNPNKY